MFSKILAPHPALAPFVKCYLAVKVDEKGIDYSPVSCKILPTLVFSYRSPANTAFRFSAMPVTDHLYLNDKPAIVGPSNSAGHTFVNGEMHSLTVVFQTTGAYFFSKETANALTNKVIKIEEIDKRFNEAQEKMWAAKNAQEAVQLLEPYLLRHFEANTRSFSHQTLSGVTDYIEQVSGLVKVEALAKRMHISKRGLEKKFKEQIGMSPKAYACAIRFRSLMTHLYNNPTLSWMEAVARYEYTDQSHLIKDFHRYTGTSPKEYFKYTLQLDQVMQETL
jgi:AraC-like DNA-binding protein